MIKQIRVFLLVAAVAATAGLGVQTLAPAPLGAQYEDGGGDGETGWGELYEKAGPETKWVCICGGDGYCAPCLKVSNEA